MLFDTNQLVSHFITMRLSWGNICFLDLFMWNSLWPFLYILANGFCFSPCSTNSSKWSSTTGSWSCDPASSRSEKAEVLPTDLFEVELLIVLFCGKVSDRRLVEVDVFLRGWAKLKLVEPIWVVTQKHEIFNKSVGSCENQEREVDESRRKKRKRICLRKYLRKQKCTGHKTV